MTKPNAVTNALDLLDALSHSEGGTRLKDLALQVGLPESTVHRLLTSLMSRGFAEQLTDGRYLLGWKVVVLANALGRDARLVQLVRPHLEQLSRTLRHTVNLAVLSNTNVMYLDCATPPNSIAVSVPPGWTLPVHATSLGKSILAFLPENERNELIDQLTFEALTQNTVTTRELLLEQIAVIQRQGFGLDHGEVRLDVSCVAAPLIDNNQRARAAISVTSPTANLPVGWEESFSRQVRATAREISESVFGARDLAVADVKG